MSARRREKADAEDSDFEPVPPRKKQERWDGGS